MRNLEVAMQVPRPTLTIVIPALNEEEAIGDTISRCLLARPRIIEEGGLAAVEIIVVSDGSTDATEEIARGFDEITVIAFESNRGYGAAIKAGIEAGQGDLVGFLDADGTCDPVHFGPLCEAAIEGEADVALGSRLGEGSQMPKVRRIGNRFFALLLGLLANRTVTDAASGMRVMRRGSLAALGPLPDGLHYTPAMSARALMGGYKVVELPMSYEERVGESKLRVVSDGVHFLRAIIDGVLYHRPERVFLLLALLCLGVAVAISLHPIEFYAGNRRIEEWMIYRFVVAFLLGTAALTSLSAAAVAYGMTDLVHRGGQRTFWGSVVRGFFGGKTLYIVVALGLVAALVLLWPGVVEYLSTGQLTLHWSRFTVGTFGFVVAFQLLVTRLLLRIMSLWLELPDPPDRTRAREA